MSQYPPLGQPAGPSGDVGSLDVRLNASFLAQKRGASRHQMPSQITVEYALCYRVMHQTDPRFWVTARDISRTGISFFHYEPMYSGERIRVELRMDRGKIRCVQAEITRCRRLQNGTFEIGAAFRERQKEPPSPQPQAPKIPDIPWIYQ